MINLYYDKKGASKNKLGITNHDEFKKAETYFYELRLNELMQSKYFSLEPDYMCKLHYKLFNDIYSWAGEYRLVNIERSEPALGGHIMQYNSFDTIEDEITKVFSDIQGIRLSDLNNDEKLNYLIFIVTRLWKIYPFRDCNTRTLIAFIDQYCKSSSLTFKTLLLKDNLEYFRRSLVVASFKDEVLDKHADNTYLYRIMNDAFDDNYKKSRQIIKA